MELTEWIKKAVTMYQAVDTLKKEATALGYIQLDEKEEWELYPGKNYFVIRNDSAFISFKVPKKPDSYHVFACHSDSPSFKVKENPEMSVGGTYVRLNVEPYGGMIPQTWLDRPLSVAGRVIVKRNGTLESIPVNVDQDLLLIPNVAIHQMKDYTYNPQEDMLPLYGLTSSEGTFLDTVADAAGVKKEDILGHDLYLYLRENPVVWGRNNEFISAPRLDDLECALAGFIGFTEAVKEDSIALFSLLANEEVGSKSIGGAGSTFLKDVISRISESLGDTENRANARIARSFLLSADNGHALHPNHPEKTDPTNKPVLNGGVLLKYSAAQRYTTDGFSAAFVKNLCNEAGVKYQLFFNRSDMPGGSTLGNISLGQLPTLSADIGLAELAMHSAYETAGAYDFEEMVKLARAFFA